MSAATPSRRHDAPRGCGRAGYRDRTWSVSFAGHCAPIYQARPHFPISRPIRTDTGRAAETRLFWLDMLAQPRHTRLLTKSLGNIQTGRFSDVQATERIDAGPCRGHGGSAAAGGGGQWRAEPLFLAAL